jgi:anion-transporting  ArsA/GET3 family ATPase
MRILVCTGNGGIGSSLVAAATASAAAQAGQKTLLASIGPSHGLNGLFDGQLSSETRTLAPNLDAWSLDVPNDLHTYFEPVRPKLIGALANLSSDELPLIPGIDFFLALERLRRSMAAGYDLTVVDAGPHDALLRVLALPDSFRWFVRLLFGLDRGPGQSSASVGRSLVPTSLLPFEWVGQVQDARTQLEQVRNDATASPRTTLRYVLRPDTSALYEARLAVPALHLHGLAMDGLVVGPLLPVDIQDPRMAEMVAQQQQVAVEAENTWAERPILRLPFITPQGGAEPMATLGRALYMGRPAAELAEVTQPIIYHDSSDDPFISIDLPGIPREALGLTLSGDELIVRAGPYRRHLLLPPRLRGAQNIRASREGSRLVVRLRQA